MRNSPSETPAGPPGLDASITANRHRGASSAGFPLIVHSHLRWDFVWQRPQQLLSRLARHAPVLFVEEPIFLDDASRPRLDITTPFANVLRVIPRLPGNLRDDVDAGIEASRALVQEAISDTGTLKG